MKNIKNIKNPSYKICRFDHESYQLFVIESNESNEHKILKIPSEDVISNSFEICIKKAVNIELFEPTVCNFQDITQKNKKVIFEFSSKKEIINKYPEFLV